MGAFHDIVDTLKTRVSEVKVHNPKAHMGEKWLRAAMVSKGDRIIPKSVAIALNGLLTRFKSDSSNSQVGHAMSAEITINIGKVVEEQVGEPTTNTTLHASIGAAILGMFLREDYIKQYRDPAYSEYDKTAPYVIAATEKFAELGEIPEEFIKDLIYSTSLEPIPEVSEMVQGNKRSIIKDYNEEQEADLEEAITVDMPWLVAANKLQRTGWRINREVFVVIEQNFDSLLKEIRVRPGVVNAVDVKKAFESLKNRDTKANRDKYNRTVKLWNKELEVISDASKNAERHLIRAKARALINVPAFYQYVELDYRGRIYYQEPLLNYQGPDMARGLLEFSEGKSLGQEGVRWLAIHTSACYNQSYGIDDIPSWCTYDYKTMLEEQGLESIAVDKMTLKDREEWAWQNMEFILDSVDKILDCEKPIGFLACCLEWQRVEVDGFETVSHLPISIDGSCNGYQHSAAIAKDEITGSLVSLTPQEVQSDLYLKSAQELVTRMPDFFDARPDMAMKHIRKGITKRAVMTRAYSAGKDKIADSMYKDCHSEGYTDKFDITMLNCNRLASSVYDLIKDVCPGATKTMKFLQDLATYELGKFEHRDTTGKKVSKAKRNQLHAKRKALRKIKPDEITPEQLKELSEVSQTLDSHGVVCTYGNGMKSMDWWTPSGFHVIYEAWQQTSLKIYVTYPGWNEGHAGQKNRLKFSILEDTPYPNVRAFQSGISPNFIHSMDASHMAIVIANWDGAFGAVHDSFSTHACDVDKLAEVTRDKFVDLYDVHDPYAAIAEMILSPCVYDEELPELGTLDIQEVRNSPYFFC